MDKFKCLTILLLVISNSAFSLTHRFAIIGDPHIHSGTVDRIDRLTKAIDYLNFYQNELLLKFVVIVGDVALDGYGLTEASKIFNQAGIPCVPIIGDNEQQNGLNNTVFSLYNPLYDKLNVSLATVSKLSANKSSLSFEIDGMTYVILDATANTEYATIDSETEQWFRLAIGNASKRRKEYDYDYVNNVIVFSHHPLSFHYNEDYGITDESFDKIKAIDDIYPSTIVANFCGHAHVTFEWKKDDFIVFKPLWDTYFTESLFNLKESAPANESAEKAANYINVFTSVICNMITRFAVNKEGSYSMVETTYNCPSLSGSDLLDYCDGKLFTSEYITIAVGEVSVTSKMLAAGRYNVVDGYLRELDNSETGVGTNTKDGTVVAAPAGRSYGQFGVNVKYINIKADDNPGRISYSIGKKN